MSAATELGAASLSSLIPARPARNNGEMSGRSIGSTQSYEPKGSRFRYVVFADSLRVVRRTANFSAPTERPAAEPAVAARPEDDAFLLWLLGKAGLDPAQYRLETLRRRLPAVLRGVRAGSSGEARSLVQRDLSLLPVALSAAIIGVTSFFREPDVFDVLRAKLAALARPVRVWSLGCSDGAELFSVAILLDELGRLDGSELLGTDCRSEAIAAARDGFFHAHALNDVSAVRRCSYLDLYPGKWRVTNRLRQATTWRLGNALAYVEPGLWDVILCRNLAIYLRDDAIAALWRRLTTALRPGGVLVAGKADRPSDGTRLASIGPCVYRRESL
jgi:chemotaxis methyl-accepting protein methylase